MQSGATPLPDNNSNDEYCYEVNIWTGFRPGSGTTSRIALILEGDDFDTDPRVLCDPDRPVFQKGSVNTFLLTSPYSLGTLSAVRYELGGKVYNMKKFYKRTLPIRFLNFNYLL